MQFTIDANCVTIFLLFAWGHLTILSGIHSPKDLKELPEKQLSPLASEIRKIIIETCAKNGGHLASNLGVVELTLALHRVFNSPEDALVFDVSHQCYTHKLLTGRYQNFSTLRQKDGLSGFTRHTESPHDFFDNGHSSTSISQALGLLTAWEYEKKDGKVVAVIGDGALTGGMAFEALSHAGQLNKNLIVVLNDNQMSISKNDGSLSRYLSRITMTRTYQGFRNTIDHIVDRIPYAKHHLGKLIFRFKRGLKGLFLTNNLFTDLGFEYVGPLNGHDIRELEEVFARVKKLPRPVVVHVITKKGKGYSPAENDPASFHGVGPFQISDGTVEKFDTLSFTESFSNALLDLAQENPKIAAITAAMSKGTGLDAFSRHYSNRFFDVGIAEEHAVTFASGLAKGGMIPVVAIYSTFIQRSIDQIIHDVSLPSAHVILCFDRSGAVSADGETHQGIFDISLLRPVPNLAMLAPASASELSLCLRWAVDYQGPVAIRYPKASCPSELSPFSQPLLVGRGVLIQPEHYEPPLSVELEDQTGVKRILFVSTGGMFSEVQQAARSLFMEGIYCDIYNLRFIKPLDRDYFVNLAGNYDGIVLVEDGVEIGGIARFLHEILLDSGFNSRKIALKAFPDRFFSQGNRSQVLEDAGLSPKDLALAAKETLSLSGQMRYTESMEKKE